MYSRPSAFGPPSSGNPTSGNRQGGSLRGYNAPFTPPYYDGAATARIIFEPTQTKRYTLEEILSGSTILYKRYQGWSSGSAGTTGPQNGDDQINNNAVQVSASVNLFGSTLGLQDLLKYEGVNLTTQESRWCIQTKFETPILNFVDSSASATPVTDTDICKGGEFTRPYGMWHQYGRIPKAEEGIYLQIDDPISTVTANLSLADLVGFSKSSEKLGQVAKSKTIREAIVAVPFIETDNSRKFFDVKVGESMSDSVAKMVDSMERYVFPPSMDFLNYPKEVNPFAMYVFEFEHQLNQQDLSDIWQNLPPRIGRAFDSTATIDSSEIVQEKRITHSLINGELLEKTDAKLQWMMFKVKQKAQNNYWDKTVATNPSLDKTNGIDTALPTAGIDGILKSTSGKYNYNWPYDFFSLVELVKIDEEIGFTKDEAVKTNRLIPIVDTPEMPKIPSSSKKSKKKSGNRTDMTSSTKSKKSKPKKPGTPIWKSMLPKDRREIIQKYAKSGRITPGEASKPSKKEYLFLEMIYWVIYIPNTNN
jgi:hypothetical protein